MSESTLIEAQAAIRTALEQAEEIKAAGPQSLLAIAAHALAPEERLTLATISRTLGWHPSVVVAITVAGDLAGDTNSRREYGLGLFERLPLQASAPRLTGAGLLNLGTFCIEQLLPMAEVLGQELLQGTLEICRAAAAGAPPARGRVLELQQQATELQRLEVVGVGHGRTKVKTVLGISDEQKFQRHAGQALRALLQHSLEPETGEVALSTVTGEVTRALGAGVGFAAAAGFTLELSHHLSHELPADQRRTTPAN